MLAQLPQRQLFVRSGPLAPGGAAMRTAEKGYVPTPRRSTRSLFSDMVMVYVGKSPALAIAAFIGVMCLCAPLRSSSNPWKKR